MTDAVAQGKSPIWMRVTLFISLALNLLVVGVVAGAVVSGGPEKRGDRGSRQPASVFTRALEPEDRRALRRAFVSELAKQGRDRGAIVSDLQSALDMLRASPFDAERFSQTLAEQSNRRSQREEIGRTALSARIAAMTDGERAAYADRVEDALMDLSDRMRR